MTVNPLFWIAILHFELTTALTATSSVWKYNETAPVVIIGGYSQPSGLIFASLNETDGSLTAFNGPSDVGANPSTLTVNQQRKYNMIYTVNEVDGNGGRVVTAPFDPSDNYSIDINNIVSQSSFGGTPAFISHDILMTFVYIANYGAGDINSSFAIFKINQETGYLSDEPIVYKTFDTHDIDPNATVSHIHCIVPNPNDLFHFYVADLGRNVVEHYRMDYDATYDTYSLTLMSSLEFPDGSGPRTFAYNPVMNGILYLSQETKSQVSVLTFDVDSHELLQIKQTLSSLHKASESDNAQDASEWGTSHVRCDNDGKYLYLANRVTNTIASFTVNTTNGLLIEDSMHINECKGVVPRYFNIDTKNEYMLVCNQEWDETGKDANVASFKINHNNDGHLDFVSKFDTDRPTWAYIITPNQDNSTDTHNASNMVLIIAIIVIVIILVLMAMVFVKKTYDESLKKDDNYKTLLNPTEQNDSDL